jgi:integrase
MKAKLTKPTVAALTLPECKNEEIYWCDQLDRFGLRLRRSGGRVVKTWVVQYRRARATRRMAVGKVETVSPEQARLAARKLLGAVDQGHDPQAERDDRRDKDKLSFRAAVAQYLEVKRGELRPATLQHTVAYLTRPQYFRALWSMPLDQVTRKDVAAQLLSIASHSGRPTANCARSALSAFYRWSLQHGLTDSNPVVGTRQPKANPPRDRVLTDTELAAVWRAANGMDDFSRIVRLLILLPCRRQEVGSMAWSELDLDGGSWTIPASRTKNNRAVTLPLTDMVLAIIQAVPQRAGRDWLFGEHHQGGFCSWHKCKGVLDTKTGISEVWNLHDIRRTVATRMADLGVAPHVIEQILNHQSGHKRGVGGIYNRSSYLREVAAALALWADHVNALVTGGERKVVALVKQLGPRMVNN